MPRRQVDDDPGFFTIGNTLQHVAQIQHVRRQMQFASRIDLFKTAFQKRNQIGGKGGAVSTITIPHSGSPSNRLLD